VKKNNVSPGDYVLLLGKGKTWLVRAMEGYDFHTHLGKVRFSDILGKPFGSPIYSEKGEKLFALRPTIEDFVMKCERQTQIVYPKDLGMISLEADIRSGSSVLEAGSGSGAMTTYLASLVAPKGHVYTYELREEFKRMAERNVMKAGLEGVVTFKLQDASKGFEEKNIDACVIDVGDPWVLVPQCWKALRPSGRFVGVTPTMNQAERLSEVLRASGFSRVKCIEIMLRNIEAREGKTRPSMMMVGHTAYLIFATKVLETSQSASSDLAEAGEDL
jgi:tRNA (adenine57-N1/adenine58-N1)-methyltransferase